MRSLPWSAGVPVVAQFRPVALFAGLAAALLFAAGCLFVIAALSPSDPGPLGGSWRKVGAPGGSPGNSPVVTFKAGSVVEGGVSAPASFRVGPDPRSVVVTTAAGGVKEFVVRGDGTAIAGPELLLKIFPER